ncbi:MAG: trehalose synthase [Candidatus Binatia bacterium]|nr:MAG: trehalose synthase [Candidatus Binatia bacterium]
MKRPHRYRRPPSALESDPLWYKDAIVYQVHVRAFYDSDGDGGGDFRGLTEKLDYLQDLGVTAVWLLPFYPSPLKDDGYDIADYTDIHRSYGTLRDVEAFFREAHARGIRVITELVLNHTSDQHPWFQRARRAKPGSSWRNFYVWSDTPDRYADARIIFKDFETSNWTWDPVAKAYYWHRFYSHQPDLNYDNPAVRRAIFQVLDFWFRMGVDGMRLDAVPYLYEREGTNCENLPETHAFLKALRKHVDTHFADRMLLAEANQWPEDAAAYFGDGDECHMAFHFPIMPRLFMGIHMEDRFPILDILEQTPPIPPTAQWALFLRNHDELTLEMVTDEERDYMYRVYASDPQARINLGIRRRLAPLLGNNRRKIELMNGLLFSLPGTPVIYYGDEIGMGDNIYLGDRNGVRTPMQWSADRNAGFSRADPQRLYLPVVMDSEHNPQAVNVEQQQNNLHSLLWWMKRLVALRKRYGAFGRGDLEVVPSENRKVLSFVRSHGDEKILVVANLSRFVTFAELDLSRYVGLVPVELFGSTEFPLIEERPYFLTLAPHSFYWFALQPPRRESLFVRDVPVEARPLLRVGRDWWEILGPTRRSSLERVLPDFLVGCRWFGGKARRIRGATAAETLRFSDDFAGLLVNVGYVEGEPETYFLPVSVATGEEAELVRRGTPGAVVARLRLDSSGEEGLLYDASVDGRFARLLLDAMARRRRFRGAQGELLGVPARLLRKVPEEERASLEPRLLGAEQSNTSVVYGDRFILKVFRKLDEGENPDLEIGRFLTEKANFPNVPPVGGWLSYERPRKPPITVGILQGFVPNQGDAWCYTLEMLGASYERVLAERPPVPAERLREKPLEERLEAEPPESVRVVVGAYFESVRLLGQRTAELHLALAKGTDPAFAPEGFSTLYQRSLYQSLRTLARQTLELVARERSRLPEPAASRARALLEGQAELDRRFRAILGRKLSGQRIRCHGDYHLGQVLYTGRDFVILDFEGEPARPLGERRLKRTPLRDVAGMIRSFHYAAHAALSGESPGTVVRPEDRESLAPWAEVWYEWVAAAFLRSYLATAEGAAFLPRTAEEIELLLDFYSIEKALYEIRYELNHRPEWVAVPLGGIVDLLGGGRS